MHGDNKGLVLPPKVAPTQVVIVPIKTSKDNAEEILGKGNEIYEQLKKENIRVISTIVKCILLGGNMPNGN